MRFSPTHAPPMANTYASQYSSIDLAATSFSHEIAAGNDSTTLTAGAGALKTGTAAGLLA